MSDLEINKVSGDSDRSLPIFAEFDRIADQIRLEAYNLFAHRSTGDGHALDDWLKAERQHCWPAAELAEKDDAYTLKVALPGFEPNEIDLTATPHEIMIKARHEHEASGSDEESSLRWSEFRSNDVFRRFELEKAVDVESVAADLRNGMLEITAPKADDGDVESRKVELSKPA